MSYYFWINIGFKRKKNSNVLLTISFKEETFNDFDSSLFIYTFKIFRPKILKLENNRL